MGAERARVATRVSLRVSTDLCAFGSPAAKEGVPSCFRTPAVAPACHCSLSALGRRQPGLKPWLRARQSPVVWSAPARRFQRAVHKQKRGNETVPASRLWDSEATLHCTQLSGKRW